MIENTETLFLLDSNIFIYAYDKDEKDKHPKALALLKKCWKREVKYAVSPQNLSEFFVIITKKIKNPISIKEAKNIVSDIIRFSHFVILNINQNTILAAIGICEKTGCYYYDSLIAATMWQHNISSIYTEDTKDFNKIEGIKAKNPFK